MPKTITPKSVFFYFLRFLRAIITLEIIIQLFWVIAIKDTKAWKGFSPIQIYTLGYLNLKHIWLKLLIIWSFFRLWALSDGIETIENMDRCMSNNFSPMAFWRHWHRSYNRWLIRYVYIPLGGKKYYALNIFPIFTFVAGLFSLISVWHDIQLRMLYWGWLIALFILPEIIAIKVFCTTRMRKLLGDWHLHLCAVGAVMNIFMMY